MHPILMPQAGQSMTEGKVVRWLVQEGSPVKKGDPLLEIETDKADMEVEASADGVLRKVLHGEGAVVAVLTPVGVIAGADEALDLSALAVAGAPSAAPVRGEEPAGTAVPEAAPAAAPAPALAGRRPGRIPASP